MPESSIKEQFEDFRKGSNIFISYQRDDIELAKAIAIRLKKYEFNVWIDFSDLRAGDIFQEAIKNALVNAVNNGFVITLMNERILDSHSWARKELMTALYKGHPESSIIPVVQDKGLWKKYVKIFH